MDRLRIGRVRIELHEDGFTNTIFPGRGSVPALAQKDEQYQARAVELGYNDNTAQMSRDHEILHTLLHDALDLGESPTLLGCASRKYAPKKVYEAEEAFVMGAQLYLRMLGIDIVDLARSLSERN